MQIDSFTSEAITAVNNSIQQPPKMTATKRQAAYFYANTQNDSASNKRRRQTEEPDYAAAAFQKAFAGSGPSPPMSILSGRRERALPLGSVDMELARVMTSSEFDCDEEEVAMNGDSEQEEDQQPVEKKNDKAQDYDPYGDVSSMRMLASLVQSTRNYYGFASYDTAATKNEPSNVISSSNDQTNITQAYNSYNSSYNTEKTPSEDHAECLSSWTPSSSCNNLNDNKRKNINNNNRSDGQSRCDKGEGESSSDSISSSEHNSPPNSPQPKGKEPLGSIVDATLNGAFLVVG